MDGKTPIDCYAPQFTQREAADLAGVDMATINNWLLRGDFKLAESDGRRRLFSIGDIAALHTMHYCVKMLDMRPAAAGYAGEIVRSFYRSPHAADKDFTVWHIVKKASAYGPGDGDGWTAQGIWQSRETGAFYHYDPVAYGTDDPFGFPHFPCLSIPTSELAFRIFLHCCDTLMEEHGAAPGTASQGLDDQPLPGASQNREPRK